MRAESTFGPFVVGECKYHPLPDGTGDDPPVLPFDPKSSYLHKGDDGYEIHTFKRSSLKFSRGQHEERMGKGTYVAGMFNGSLLSVKRVKQGSKYRYVCANLGYSMVGVPYRMSFHGDCAIFIMKGVQGMKRDTWVCDLFLPDGTHKHQNISNIVCVSDCGHFMMTQGRKSNAMIFKDMVEVGSSNVRMVAPKFMTDGSVYDTSDATDITVVYDQNFEPRYELPAQCDRFQKIKLVFADGMAVRFDRDDSDYEVNSLSDLICLESVKAKRARSE